MSLTLRTHPNTANLNRYAHSCARWCRTGIRNLRHQSREVWPKINTPTRTDFTDKRTGYTQQQSTKRLKKPWMLKETRTAAVVACNQSSSHAVSEPACRSSSTHGKQSFEVSCGEQHVSAHINGFTRNAIDTHEHRQAEKFTTQQHSSQVLR